jgi:hypothetical protein
MDTVHIHFDHMKTGFAPEGWVCGVTGKGTPRWTVEADPSAASAPNVLKQTGSGTFPWCVLRSAQLSDGIARIELDDGHIEGAGAVGVWTKADSITAFDDFAYGPGR